MLKIENKKRFISFVAAIILAVAGVIFVAYKTVKWYGLTPAIERMSIKDAAKTGEKKTVQLLVQIADMQNAKGVLARGDVVLSAPTDKQFSTAEQEGFLIIKINLTPSQQQLLALSLNEKAGIFSSGTDHKQFKEIKRRKFAVDLAKIGIEPEQKTGKVIDDRIFEDDVLVEKK